MSVRKEGREETDLLRYAFTSARTCEGGRNAPPGLYTRSSFRGEPGWPKPAALSRRSPAIERSKTLLPRCVSTFFCE